MLSEDGKSSAIDSQQTRDALDFMVNGIKDGAAPKAVVTAMEEQSRADVRERQRDVHAQLAVRVRHRPEVRRSRASSRSRRFPGFQGNPGAGVLGGTNLAISEYTENPGGALAVVNYFTGEVGQRLIGEGATPPATTAAYDVESVRKAIGLPDEIKDAVGRRSRGPSRRCTRRSPRRSTRTSTRRSPASSSTDDAVTNMNSQIEKALATF